MLFLHQFALTVLKGLNIGGIKSNQLKFQSKNLCDRRCPHQFYSLTLNEMPCVFFDNGNKIRVFAAFDPFVDAAILELVSRVDNGRGDRFDFVLAKFLSFDY